MSFLRHISIIYAAESATFVGAGFSECGDKSMVVVN